MKTTTGYLASILAIIHGLLVLLVVRSRIKLQKRLGSEGMQMVVRAHANFVENVPLSLILLGLLEYELGTADARTILILFGSGYIFGRIMHAFAFLDICNHMFGRILGTFVTITTNVMVAVLLLFGQSLYTYAACCVLVAAFAIIRFYME